MAQSVKNLPAMQETQVQFLTWVGKIPWRREWLPTPVFFPGEFYGQRSLAGYSPWDHKKLDMTEKLTLSHILLLKPIKSELGDDILASVFLQSFLV